MAFGLLVVKLNEFFIDLLKIGQCHPFGRLVGHAAFAVFAGSAIALIFVLAANDAPFAAARLADDSHGARFSQTTATPAFISAALVREHRFLLLPPTLTCRLTRFAFALHP